VRDRRELAHRGISAAIAIFAIAPLQRVSGRACGITTSMGKRVRSARIAAGSPTWVCFNPSSPRSPDPCRNQQASASPSPAAGPSGTNTW
jgi:hypothetical protein